MKMITKSFATKTRKKIKGWFSLFVVHLMNEGIIEKSVIIDN